LKIAAPAKINLALHVTGQQPDGYHLIESLVVFADAADQITIEPSETDTLTFSGPFGALLSNDPGENLVLKARDALRAATSSPCPTVAILLEKSLPLSSGIGGGSADAAATLKGLNEQWLLGLPLAELCAIGAKLGADVPMCLYGQPLIAKGIGEIIEPLHDFPELHLLLVNPGVAVSTPAIFKALVNKNNEGLPSISPLRGEMSPQATERGSLDEFITHLRTTRNDLQPPALNLQPIIAETIAVLEHSGALFARMSGSGATCFGIFGERDAKDRATVAMAKKHPHWWIA
jgi:4-diphosphocytidyl-2-C-methyl-D-erythritol kinase